LELIAQVELDQVDHVDQRIIRFGGSAVYKVSIEAWRGRRIVAWRTKLVHCEREYIPLTIPLDGGEPLICVNAVFAKDGIDLHCSDGLKLLMRFYLAFSIEPDDQVLELPLTRRKRLKIRIARQSTERCSECALE